MKHTSALPPLLSEPSSPLPRTDESVEEALVPLLGVGYVHVVHAGSSGAFPHGVDSVHVLLGRQQVGIALGALLCRQAGRRVSVGHPSAGLLYTGIRRIDANSTTHGVKAELLLEKMTPPVASATTGKQVL